MSDIDTRIAQFEHMAAEDPDNEMAHFSLGNALLKAGRHADAASSYQRCIQLNPQMSKAYQLAGEALIESGRKQEATDVLSGGYEVAARNGDMMPQKAIKGLLAQIGVEPPEVAQEQPPAAGGPETGDSAGRATGRAGQYLPEPPMRGALGKWIHENITADTWQSWIGQGTKVINELRLDLSREEDQVVFERNMCEFLGIDEALAEKLTQQKRT